jgi:MFS family permease
MTVPSTEDRASSQAENLSPQAGPLSQRIYRVGTLQYSLTGLMELCFWLLLGDFAYNLIEQVIPSVLPLTLKELGASNATIGLLVGTLASVINVIVNPIVSFNSDRHRGRFGRRIPFIFIASPCIALFMICVGSASQIAEWLRATFGLSAAHPNTVVLAVLTGSLILFQIFYMVAASVYYYLLSDVVPHNVIGRFYGFFRLVGAAGGFVFNRYVLRFADHPDTRWWIYVSMGLVWLLCFSLLCWRVQEGEYPPADPAPADGIFVRFGKAVQTYLRECFCIRFYWWLYLASSFYTIATTALITFRLLLAKDLGMDLEQAGSLLSWVFLAGVVLYVPLGWLADKLHPIRLNIIGVGLTFAVLAISALLVRTPATFSALTMLWALAWLTYTASGPALTFVLLPRLRFGQFGSAVAITNSLAAAIANYAGGRFIDWMGARYQGQSAYLGIYFWGAIFTGLSFVFMALLYREWARLGGRKHFTPPVQDAAPGFPIEPAARQ